MTAAARLALDWRVSARRISDAGRRGVSLLRRSSVALLAADRSKVTLLGLTSLPARPGHSDVTQHSRIDDDSPEGIDQAHVPRGKATHRPDVDAPVEAVAQRTPQQRQDPA